MRRFPSMPSVLGWLGLVGTRMWVGLEIGPIARFFFFFLMDDVALIYQYANRIVKISTYHQYISKKQLILWKYRASDIFLACVMSEVVNTRYNATFSFLIVWMVEKPSFYNSLRHLPLFSAHFPLEKLCFRFGFFLISLWFL